MIINVTDSVRINAESGCTTLERKAVVGAGGSSRGAKRMKEENIGAVRWESVGYYGSIEQAANALLVKHYTLLTKAEEATIAELIVELRRAAQQIADACKGVVRCPS